MRLDLFQVDAFTGQVFGGNPAAVVPLERWPEDTLLQAIAMENNLSETAFFAPEENDFRLRWFTPQAEVDLCGHATLATAHVLFEHLGHRRERLSFRTRSGALTVRREAVGYCMDFPASASRPIALPEGLVDGFGGLRPKTVLAGPDLMAVFEHEADVASLTPDFAVLACLDARGVIATAPGDSSDFVSRCFFPKLGVNEDPVTGSAHCQMGPYWAERLGRVDLGAHQLSARSGRVDCRVRGERVELLGQAMTYLVGTLRL